jgi:hypothetical protein
MVRVQIQAGIRDIPLLHTGARLALGPIKPLLQWVLEALSLEVNDWGLMLTIHLHLLLRLRMVELYLLLPHSCSWQVLIN